MGRNSDVLVRNEAFFNAPKEPSKLTCHPHLSKSTLMGYMPGRVCLLQTFPHSHTIQGFIMVSLTCHHYLVFNILPKIPLWWLAWSFCGNVNHLTFLLQDGLKANWRPFNSGPSSRNLFHPTSFSQCSRSSPQFSSFQSETPVLWLWDFIEYTCSIWNYLVSSLGLTVTPLGVLPRLAF